MHLINNLLIDYLTVCFPHLNPLKQCLRLVFTKNVFNQHQGLPLIHTIIAETLTYPFLWTLVLTTTENAWVPRSISYAGPCGNSKDIPLFFLKNANAGNIRERFETPLVSLARIIVYLLLIPRGSACQQLLTIQLPFVALNTLSFQERFSAKLPAYVGIPMKLVNTIKTEIPSEVCLKSTNLKSMQHSFRTLYSTPTIANNLCREALSQKIPTRLSLVLQSRYIDVDTARSVSLSQDEACCCTVFSQFSTLACNQFPTMVQYVVDTENIIIRQKN